MPASFLHKERGFYEHHCAPPPNNYIATQSKAVQVNGGREQDKGKQPSMKLMVVRSIFLKKNTLCNVHFWCGRRMHELVFFCKKKESFDERQMAWSPSWESFSLYFLSKSQLHIGQTEPCCSPSAWHVKRQSVHFLPETSPVRRPLKTRSHKDNYAEHHFSMLHILAGHKEQQLIPVITWEGTKTVFV